jgi:hypothetical protein
METEVKLHNGAPALFIDGRASTGLTLFFARTSGAAADLHDFAEAGIDLYSGCIGLGAIRRADGSCDFAAIDAAYEYVIAANPRVKMLVRVGLDWWRPSERWRAEHPGELLQHVDADGKAIPPMACSFASPAWRREAAGDLRAYIHHCEQRFGENIVGYHLAAGAMGEWAYSWEQVLSDYSPAQAAAFGDWLRRQYGNDQAALRAAWGRPDATFEAAAVPAPQRRLRAPDQPSLLDPKTERDVIDYLEFHSETMAEAAVGSCAAAKAALREVGRRKVVGVFYGYHFKNLNKPSNFHNAGHHAQRIVLESKDVDFICAPYCYQAREHGNMYLAQLISGSVRLHGKLHWCEDDTFTFRSRREYGRSRCPDRETTIGVLRRNLAGLLAEGGTAWWMDCGGNGPLHPGGQVDGWYHDEGLMRNFAQMQRLAERRLAGGDRRPAAQVAVMLGDDSARFHRHDAALMDGLIMRQMYELGQLGAPFDTYRVADLPRLLEEPWSENYRLWVFPDCLYLSREVREALKRLKTNGRTVLWTYGAGIVTEEGISPDAMAEATGIRVGVRHRNEPLIVNTFATGSRLLYGTERPIGPVVFGADDAAEVKGWLVNEADPALLERRFDGWRSVWSAAPAMPAALLRQYAAGAGVHLYVDTGEQVLWDGQLLTLHAGFSGVRTVRLPMVSNVADAYTGEAVAAGASEFVAALERGSTATWTVEPIVA